MGAILDALVKKRQLDQLNDQNLAAIPQALQTFQQARERSVLIDLERRKTQATIDNLVADTSNASRKLGIDERVADAQISDLTQKARESGAWADLLTPQNSGTTGITAQGQPDISVDMMRRAAIARKVGLPFEMVATPEERAAQVQQKATEAAAVDAAKPYTGDEAGLISKAEEMPAKIDELIKLVNENPVYQSQARQDQAPTALERVGASNVQAFGEKDLFFQPNSLRRFFTKGNQRKAGILLKDLKVLAFGEGGKTLSENERMTALSMIDPSDKSEAEWMRGLEDAKKMLIRKGQLVSKRGEVGGTSNGQPPGLKAAGTAAIKSYDDYLKAIGR